jgi:hypothetical protein
MWWILPLVVTLLAGSWALRPKPAPDPLGYGSLASFSRIVIGVFFAACAWALSAYWY